MVGIVPTLAVDGPEDRSYCGGIRPLGSVCPGGGHRMRSRLGSFLRAKLAQHPGHRFDLSVETGDLLTRGVKIAAETRGDEDGSLERVRELLDGVLFLVRKWHFDVLRRGSTVVPSGPRPIMQNAHQAVNQLI